jgi:hypothetical protein
MAILTFFSPRPEQSQGVEGPALSLPKGMTFYLLPSVMKSTFDNRKSKILFVPFVPFRGYLNQWKICVICG